MLGIKPKLTIVVSTLILLGGCAEDRPYKSADGKIKNVKKELIDTNADYLFVQSTVESDRKSAATRPFWMGQEKVVRPHFTENSLELLEIEKDRRFTDNPTNNKPVMSIPISHLDYRCATDNYGECTNREEENRDIQWHEKDEFKVKGPEFAQMQLDFMPVAIGNYFTNCYQELSSDLILSDFTSEAINLQVEKTFLKQARCANLSDFEEIGQLTFTVRYHYSIVKLNELVDPGYKPIRYTKADETSFGFFHDTQRHLDVDNNDTEDGESHHINRWSPDKVIEYHLSENFLDPKNLALRRATEAAIEAINSGLERAGTALRVKLKNPVSGLSSGDLRHNMIVLVEDPQASGIIGYGPSATNPLTGEIVHARTVMYLGTIKKYIKYAYSDMIDEILKKKKQEQNKDKLDLDSPNLVAETGIDEDQSSPTGDFLDLPTTKFKATRPIQSNDLKEIQHFIQNPQALTSEELNLEDKVQRLSSLNAYPAELFNFAAAIEGPIEEIIAELGLKPWARLSTSEKEKVIKVLLPHVYVPTLVHEIGHNLGLRHNFAASEDTENFYSADEAEELGLKRVPQYSSMMDYAYRTTNELRILGKYDVAALRFGYAEQVELADGRLIDLEESRKTPNLELKNYRYCTDEHVGVNPTCNRFDEGSSLTEIALHYMQAYEKRYLRSNFRNQRRNFSLWDDLKYTRSIHSTFMQMRLMLERYEAISNRFGISHDHEVWETIPILKDLKQATKLAASFFVNVLTTPDTSCAVMDTKTQKLVALAPIRMVSPNAISCLDPTIKVPEGLMIIGEAGKSFQSRKDPHKGHPEVDQIDVRGVWIDKLLAAEHLFGRQLGVSIFDEFTDNFMDIPDVREQLMGVVKNLIKDQVTRPITVQTLVGPVKVKAPVSFYDVREGRHPHRILKPLHPGVQKAFDIGGNTPFQEKILESVVESAKARPNDPKSIELLTQLQVLKELPRDGRWIWDYVVYEVGHQRFFALDEEDILSAELIKEGLAAQLIDELGQEALGKALECLGQNQTKCSNLDDIDMPMRELRKKISTAGEENIKKALGGELKQSPYYTMMVRKLADLSH